MGRVAQVVNRLEQEKIGLKSQAADLRGQVAGLEGRLATAAANGLDADDLAALDAAEHDGDVPPAEGQVA